MTNANIFDRNLVDLTTLKALEKSLVLAQDCLKAFASDPDFAVKMAVAFGDRTNVEALRTAWLSGDFSGFPEIEVRYAADINGANGAFASATNKIYLSQEFLTRQQGNIAAISGVILEEIGHWVDSQINIADAVGDEGAIFAALVRGENLSSEDLQLLLQFSNECGTGINLNKVANDIFLTEGIDKS